MQSTIRRIVQPGPPGPFHGGIGDLVYATAYLDGHALRCPVRADSTGNDDI